MTSLKQTGIKKSVLFIVAGLLTGLVIFFPLNLIKTQVENAFRGTPLQLRLGHLQLGSGLSLGWSRGGLLALKAQNTQIILPQNISVDCTDFVVSPLIWPLLLTQIRASLYCKTPQNAWILASVQSAWFFSFQHPSLSVQLEQWGLEGLINLPNIELNGTLSGEIDITRANPQQLTAENLNLNLSLNKIRTPRLDMMIMQIPSLSFSTSQVRAQLSGNQLNIESLQLGGPKDQIKVQLSGNVELNAQNTPQSGELKGQLNIEPTLEKAQFEGRINLDQMFGAKDAQGNRRFTKRITANPLWILDPPISP